MKLLLITPPFTQLNTPYPATAYLKGFLNTKGIASYQCDLGIEVILVLFSKSGLTSMFSEVEKNRKKLSENAQRIFNLRNDYIKTIDAVVSFLQDQNPSLAHIICDGTYLPEASRFAQLDDLSWAFGTMGTQDKAKHLATLYLEDLSDLIVEAVDPHFGFSRYAERLGRSASSFNELHKELNKKNSFIDELMIALLSTKIQQEAPDLIAFSVPFPGNLYSAFKAAQWIKKHHPSIKIAMGGGFPNTELRSLKEVRVFSYFDFITLDDGEAPVFHLIEHLRGQRSLQDLKRTFALYNDEVTYFNGSNEKDYSQLEVGTPDYSDLLLDKYISVIEIVNPMHRMWSDGRWNKLTLAHGCYWGKCTFCDITLDYIKNYEPSTAQLLCDRIEEIIRQTGQNGFHFVDEAAPPALMKELALEIIRRKITVVWWTNIRFEKSFTQDLCVLLSASGCIAVSGGLEVASDRLLKLIDKGVTVSQVAKVASNFTQSGIMVHAYMMYGFPTQSAQETIDSLEVVRQLLQHGVIQSGFWHQFAMTAHSPVGLNPKAFKVERESVVEGTFANNDLLYVDKVGADHDAFSDGLKKSLFNYMHGVCFEFELQKWFDFKVPKTTVDPNFIEDALSVQDEKKLKPNSKIVWLGNAISIKPSSKKGKMDVVISSKKQDVVFQSNEKTAQSLIDLTQRTSVYGAKTALYSELEKEFSSIFDQVQIMILKQHGLLIL
ncbi:MAG: radical SAM protein [Bacteroidetes bacterium]|nr:radical SAM protein [Bacteroidota bacterium]